MTNGTTYYYAVWSSRGGLLSKPVQSSATPGPPPVTGLTATAGDTRSTSPGRTRAGAFDAVKVVRKAGATGPANPTDGTDVYNGTGTASPTPA